ncbi:hypothetical protein GFS33_11775 [Sulfolobus sp. E11-6]|nr:hypothetical protein GFS33_11775 [Sulfolobus sp. E11-6]
MFIKDGSLISYFSSGFPSHVRVKAIDISSPDLKVFYSPVNGRPKITSLKINLQYY